MTTRQINDNWHRASLTSLIGVVLLLLMTQAQSGESGQLPELTILPSEPVYKIDDHSGFENWNIALSITGSALRDSINKLVFTHYRHDQQLLTTVYSGEILSEFIKERNSTQLLLHNFHFAQPRSADINRVQIEIFFVAGTHIQKSLRLQRFQQKNSFRLPLEGTWFVSSGHDFGGEHRRHLTRGHFAWDFVRVDQQGRLSEGESLQDNLSYGQQVLAPADGFVIALNDSCQDNTPGTFDGGYQPNYIEIDHGGEISRLVHLQQNSVRVAVGDRVRAGQFIAQVGNSGYSDTPHLHIGFQRRVVGLNGSSIDIPIPAEFSDYRVSWHRGVDQPIEKGRPRRGQFIINASR